MAGGVVCVAGFDCAGGGDDGPVGLVARDELPEGAYAPRHGGLHGADQIGRLIFQLIGIVRVHGQHGMSGFGVFKQRLGQPGREFSERIAGRMLESDKLERFVTPDDFDKGGSRPIGALHDVPDEGRRLERRAAACQRSDDEETLAGSQVKADFDGKLAVGMKSLVQICRHWHSLSQARGPRQPVRSARSNP